MAIRATSKNHLNTNTCIFWNQRNEWALWLLLCKNNQIAIRPEWWRMKRKYITCCNCNRLSLLYWLLALLLVGIPTQQSSHTTPKTLKTPHSFRAWSPMPNSPHSLHAPPFHVPFACDTARVLNLLCPNDFLLCHLDWISSSAIRI